LLASGLNIVDALRKTGRKSDEEHAILLAFWPAIISDALLHIFEALSCFERRKQIVALNLLRKPLLDNLTYICWAIADKDGFLKALRSGDPNKISQSTVGQFRKKLFEDCGQLLVGKDSDYGVLVHNFLYDLNNPLFGLFQQAVHLVTTHKLEYSTSPENFNLIFYDASKDDLTARVYLQLPFIMSFFALAAFELLSSFKKLDESALSAFRIQTLVGLTMAVGFDNQKSTQLHRDLTSILSHLECSDCCREVSRTKRAVARFLLLDTVECRRCESETVVALSGLFHKARKRN
jgi:hypothetical protein